VIATAQRWLWVLDPAGRPRALWPLPASIEGNADPPADLAAERGEAGRVYVLDQAAAAIYAFARIGEGGPGGALGSPLVPLPQPPPGAPRPPAGSLACEIRSTVAVEPREVLIGTPAMVTLTLDGGCAPQLRSGATPGLLAHSAVVSLTLPAGVGPVPGSLEPPGTVEGRTLAWRLDTLPSGGLRLRYAVSAASSNRWHVLERGGMAWLDGWFNYGASELPTTYFYTLLPPTPTDTPRPTATPTPAPTSTPRLGDDGRRAWLPWLSRFP